MHNILAQQQIINYQQPAVTYNVAQSDGAVENPDLLSARVRPPPPQWLSWFDNKQFNGEVPVMLELRGMRITPSLISLPGPLWPGVVAPNWVQNEGLVELNYILMLNWIVWDWTVMTFKLRHHHHHHVVPFAGISMTLSRHFSLSLIASCRSSGLHPVSWHNCCMYVRVGRPAFV